MDMTKISNEYFRDIQSKMKEYTIVLLKITSKRNEPGANDIIMEHARRNLALREDGLVSIVCPVFTDPDFGGLYIFNTDVDQARIIMDDDPAVQAGIFHYDIYSCKGIPGDSLAG
jgi:hypothetical protein